MANNKHVKQFVETNKQLQKLLIYLDGQYNFTVEEKEVLKNADKHFDNLNIILSKIKK